MFAVVVTLQINPNSLEAFMPLMAENATLSLTDEPGCRQFDVATDPERPGEVLLYELYDDAAAFDAHLASAHFKSFDAAVSEMVLEKTVTTYAEVQQ